jgi:hypothetical protein
MVLILFVRSNSPYSSDTRERRGPGGEAPLAPGVVAVALHHGAVVVGDDGDRTKVVGMEIARDDAVVGAEDTHPHHGTADADEVVPFGDAGNEQLGMEPERIKVVGDALRGDLLEALMVDVVLKVQRARPLRDRRRLVERGVADAAAETGGLVAS